MIERGFDADVVAFAPDKVVECRAAVAAAGLQAEVRQVDRRDIALPSGRYALIVTESALEGLWPVEGDVLLSRLRRSVRPGGVAALAARTVNDPGFARWRAEGTSVARNTFLSPDGRVHRYLMPGELSMAFGDWLVLAALERAFPNGDDAVFGMLVVRRPTSGTLLA
jgi:hypothetical protein